MKKLTLALAVLAVVTIGLVSFTKFKAANDDQDTYIWAQMGCVPFGTGTESPGMGWYETSSPDMLPGTCPSPNYNTVCALQFHRSQVTCNGPTVVPKPGYTLWGSYRQIKYCTQP